MHTVLICAIHMLAEGNMVAAPVLWLWKLRFEEITNMPNITELVSYRSQTISAPLKLCFSLCYSMLPSNNMKNEIGIGKDASSKRILV